MKTFLILVIAILGLQFSITTNNKEFKPSIYSLSYQRHIEREIKCLADNVYYEALGESYIGKQAVAFVTMNRTRSGLFPNNVCDVVKQRTGKVCQFSWYCSKYVLTTIDAIAYNKIKKLVTHIYFNYESMDDPSFGALFFHADYVKPDWKKYMKTVKIGRHIFYTYRV